MPSRTDAPRVFRFDWICQWLNLAFYVHPRGICMYLIMLSLLTGGMCSDTPGEAHCTWCCGGSVMLWVTQTMWPHFREWFSTNKHGPICHNSVRLVGSVWSNWTGALCALKQTLHIAADACGPCEAYKWVSVWFKDGSALHAPSEFNLCLVAASLFLRCSICCVCASSPYCGSWNNAWSSLCVKVVQYVFCMLQLSVNVSEGGGAGNFPLLAAAAAAGSFSTDRGISSARLSSPSCSALRLGGADDT